LRTRCQGIITKSIDEYIKNIKSIGDIPELRPSQLHQDILIRYFQMVFSKSMKEAEKRSVLLSLVSRSVILYGSKSVSYIQDAVGCKKRIELHPQRHETEVEIPRLNRIDPIGLEFSLRVFRAEELKG
jgi:hypothetical protein